MEASAGIDKGAAKDKQESDNKDACTKGTTVGQKSTTTKLKERWLMTRKTWRYMTDAGKRLFPEGVSPTRSTDIPKVQEHFQKTCRKSKEFIPWPIPGGSTSQDTQTHGSLYYHDSVASKRTGCIPKTSTGVPIPRERERRRRPVNIHPPLASEDFVGEDEVNVSSSLPCSPTQTTFSQSGFPSPSRERHMSSDLAWVLPPEIYAQLVRCYGTSTLQHVASRLLEEQLTEEDEYEYEEEEGTEHLEIDGKRMRSIGAQTDSHLDMCVQTDQDDSAEDMVKVGAETRAETEAAFAASQAEKKEAAEASEQKQADLQETMPHKQGIKQRSISQQGSQSSQQQPFQKETPVLKKFWGRRESKGTEQIQAPGTALEKQPRGLASEKDREAPPPKGGVAAKLASLEAGSASPPGSKNAPKVPPQQQPASKSPPNTQHDKLLTKQPEKKTLKNVFKLGLKCDVESSDAPKKNLEKQSADKFKTVNYDKTLRNIKTKWTKEDDELLMQMLAQQEMPDPPKEVPKKKKKSRGIQVGEALPQFILSAFRVSSPVEIFYATRRRIKRRSSKAESTDMSGSEGSMSLASSMPTSPRYSITVADESGTRNLLLSESEAIRLTQMGATLYNKRTSLDASFDSNDGEGGREGPLIAGIPRESPIGLSNFPSYQRSMSAHQMSGMGGIPYIPPPHLQYGTGFSSRTGCSSSRYSSSQHSSMAAAAAAAAAASARGHRASLLQYLLPAVMQRSRPGGSGHSSRLVAKRIWRTRSKSQSRASAATTSTWTPMGGNLWLSVTGLVVTLENSSLLQLTEIERITLQRLALAKIAALNLGCPVNLPKDSSGSSNKKRRPYLLKRKALTTGFFDSKKDDTKESLFINSAGGQVFGLSLNKCLDNERLRLLQQTELSAALAATVAAAAAATAAAAEDLDAAAAAVPCSRKSSRTGSHASFCSLAEGAKQSNTGSLESLNLDRKRPSLASGDIAGGGMVGGPELLSVESPLVPALVTSCCRHLLQYGLHTVGIFRVSSSKKRVRQLREDFDRGGEVLLTEEHCPHDVATLLKEFFRDLPEPLLTRELYEPFLSTQKIRNRKLKLEATQHLLQLLPPSNRDTLYALLGFLTTVAEHAPDSANNKGDIIPGNMMDSSNLATMFAPNILHTHRPGTDTNVSPASLTAMADERSDCTNVVRSMIDHNKELFEVGAELLDETYHHLMDTHPEALDVMLRRRAPHNDDSRGQQLLQQLLASLLQPGGRIPPPCSPPSSPPLHTGGLEGDLESSSSVFEGSECSSSLPRSPTDHHDFDRLRCTEEEGAQRGRRREAPPADPAPPPDDRRTRRKGDEEVKASGTTDGPTEDRGWFRRRDKRSSSREVDKGGEEKERSRWFRRRDKTSPRSSIDYGIRRKGSDKKKQEKAAKKQENAQRKRQNSVDRGRESGNESTDSRDHRQRSSSDQTVTQERLRVPEPSVRRLSSPEIDACGVITASLKIPVPLQQQKTTSQYSKDPTADIPFIEDNTSLVEEIRTRRRDNSVTSRQRTGSSDSYLGQPITGTMSFQPLSNKNGEKQSHDSVLSSSSADLFTLSPSPRNTPLSDAMFASETSSPMSRATSPPVVLSPDSGTPGLSPPPSPPPPLFPRRVRKPTEQQSTASSTHSAVPLSHSSTHTFGASKSPYSTFSSSSSRGTATRERGPSSRASNIIPITRSRTAEVPLAQSGVPPTSTVSSLNTSNYSSKASDLLKMRDTTVGTETLESAVIPRQAADVVGSVGTVSGKRYTRRRPTKQKEDAENLTSTTSASTTETQLKTECSKQHHIVSQSTTPKEQQQQPSRQSTINSDSGAPGTVSPSTQLWKRWEIIASDPAEPETFV